MYVWVGCTYAWIAQSESIRLLIWGSRVQDPVWASVFFVTSWGNGSTSDSRFLGFPGGSDGKESACNARDPGSIPGRGRSPGEENGYPLQYFGLENSRECIVHGVAKSRHNWSRWSREVAGILPQEEMILNTVSPPLYQRFCFHRTHKRLQMFEKKKSRKFPKAKLEIAPSGNYLHSILHCVRDYN